MGNSLLGAAKWTKNVDPNKHTYSENGARFDLYRKFSLPNNDGCGKNAIILEIDNSCSSHAVNRKKDILILGKTQHMDWMIL